MDYNDLEMQGEQVGEGAFNKLEKILAPLVEEGSLIYLPEFWCCGSCASYALGSIEEMSIETGAVVHFNEQTADRAGDSWYLDLTVLPIRDRQILYSDTAENFSEIKKEEINRIVVVLKRAGFTQQIVPPDDHWANFELETFDTSDGFLVVRDKFKFEYPEEAEYS